MKDQSIEKDKEVVAITPSRTSEKLVDGASGRILGGEMDIVGNVYPVSVGLQPYWDDELFFWDIQGGIKAPVVAYEVERDYPAIPCMSDVNGSQSVKVVNLALGERGKVLVRASLSPGMAEEMAAALIRGIVTFSPERSGPICDAMMDAVKAGMEDGAEADKRRKEFDEGIRPAVPPAT